MMKALNMIPFSDEIVPGAVLHDVIRTPVNGDTPSGGSLHRLREQPPKNGKRRLMTANSVVPENDSRGELETLRDQLRELGASLVSERLSSNHRDEYALALARYQLARLDGTKCDDLPDLEIARFSCQEALRQAQVDEVPATGGFIAATAKAWRMLEEIASHCNDDLNERWIRQQREVAENTVG